MKNSFTTANQTFAQWNWCAKHDARRVGLEGCFECYETLLDGKLFTCLECKAWIAFPVYDLEKLALCCRKNALEYFTEIPYPLWELEETNHA